MFNFVSYDDFNLFFSKLDKILLTFTNTCGNIIIKEEE
jgi:hypothetical protein